MQLCNTGLASLFACTKWYCNAIIVKYYSTKLLAGSYDLDRLLHSVSTL